MLQSGNKAKDSRRQLALLMGLHGVPGEGTRVQSSCPDLTSLSLPATCWLLATGQSLYAEPQQTVFTSDIVQDAKLRYVRNSGVCETTPGVNQMSGYIDIATNMSMVPPDCSTLPFRVSLIHICVT